jgi:hypothetical protein
MPSTSHRAYVSTRGEGHGRYSHKVTCSCGANLGTYSNKPTAEKTASDHERTGR